jgi:GT2 family glycosyltransferase
MPSRPRISIAIPSKNRPNDIRRCLASIADQSVGADQVIVIDQSTQPYELAAGTNLLHDYNPHLSGLTAARNRAVDLAHHEIVMFLDDDCELEADCLANLFDAIAAWPDAIGFNCRLSSPARTGRFTRLRNALFAHGFFETSPRARADGTISRLSGGAMAVRAHVFPLERFDENLTGYCWGEDFDFSKRASRHGAFVFAGAARIIHHASAANRASARRMIRTRWETMPYLFVKLGGGNDARNYLNFALWLLGELTVCARLRTTPPFDALLVHRKFFAGNSPTHRAEGSA